MGDCRKEIKLENARPDQFYSVFKRQAYRLKDICPDIVCDIQLADGATDWEAAPGLCKTIEYQFTNGQRHIITDRVHDVDASTKTINYVIEYGEMKDNISNIKLQVKDDSTAVWTVSYIKNVPGDYLNLMETVSKAVDKSLRQN